MSLPKVLSIKVNQISFSNGDFVIVHPIHYLSLVVSNVDLISAAGFEPNKLSTVPNNRFYHYHIYHGTAVQ